MATAPLLDQSVVAPAQSPARTRLECDGLSWLSSFLLAGIVQRVGRIALDATAATAVHPCDSPSQWLRQSGHTAVLLLPSVDARLRRDHSLRSFTFRSRVVARRRRPGSLAALTSRLATPVDRATVPDHRHALHAIDPAELLSQAWSCVAAHTLRLHWVSATAYQSPLRPPRGRRAGVVATSRSSNPFANKRRTTADM